MKKILLLFLVTLFSVCSLKANPFLNHKQPNDSLLFAACKYYKVQHPEIVVAQAHLETGHYKSKLCVEFGNLFGLKRNGKYYHYKHWSESVKDYKERVQCKYTKGDYYAFLVRIGYAESPTYITHVKQMFKFIKKPASY